MGSYTEVHCLIKPYWAPWALRRFFVQPLSWSVPPFNMDAEASVSVKVLSLGLRDRRPSFCKAGLWNQRTRLQENLREIFLALFNLQYRLLSITTPFGGVCAAFYGAARCPEMLCRCGKCIREAAALRF